MKPRRIGKLVLFLVLIGAALTIGVRGMIRSWELQRRLACAEQMKRVGAAVKAHVAEMNEPIATTLEWLVEEGAVRAEDLKCPAATHANYVLLMNPLQPGRSTDDDAILYEPTGNHGDGGNVLFADGHVSFVRGEDFKRLTHRQD